MCLNNITARHLATNPASGKILENLGLIWNKSDYQKDQYGKSVKFEFFETLESNLEELDKQPD